ncbi:MAG: type 1 glutamine amidotransferase family protein [Acidobacteriota bacterium]
MEAQTVHLYVFDGMADWEAAFAIAGINHPRFQREPGRFRVRTVGQTPAHIATMGGVRIQPDLALDDLNPTGSAMLILPGGESWEREANPALIRKVDDFLGTGIPVAAICAATLALARAGFLDNRLHTSNSADYLRATGYRGASLYRNIPAIADGHLITASGAAPIEFAYQIFGMLGVYTDPMLDAWFALFRQGDASKYSALAAEARQA